METNFDLNTSVANNLQQPKFTVIHNLILDIAENKKLDDEFILEESATEMHYIVETVYQYIEAAKAQGILFGYDGEGGFRYRYKGCWWKVSPNAISRCLAEAASLMGYKYYESFYYKFGEELLKQFKSATFRTDFSNSNKENSNV